jgi:hypothetical protein
VNKSIVFAGRVTGIIGTAVCAISGLARVAGMYYVLGFESTTLFTVGMGLMVFSCMIRLEELTAQGRE